MVRADSTAIKAETEGLICGTLAPLLLLTSSSKSLLLSLRNVYETLAISAPTVVDAMRGSLSRRTCDERLESWAAHVVRNAGIAITVRGRENIEPNKTHVLMSNHQSHYDVAVLFYILGGGVRMVAKKELFAVPIFGRAMREAGFIEVDRGNHQKAVASLSEAKRHLASGTQIWIAPEGTRSPTGELMPFKKGGFVIAIDMGAPILPISIQGTRAILPSGGLRSRPRVDVTVTIHPAIAVDPTLERKAARDKLMADVRRAIASAL
jgi:1-acyl-sn-glycerol-3-phosphate acyltransferase